MMKTITLMIVCLLPVSVSANDYGLEPENKTTVQPESPYGLDDIKYDTFMGAILPTIHDDVLSQKICVTFADGTKRCFDNEEAYQAFVGGSFSSRMEPAAEPDSCPLCDSGAGYSLGSTSTVSTVTSPVSSSSVLYGMEGYRAHWSVAGGYSNIDNHMIGWPHNVDVTNQPSLGAKLYLHDADHDVIGPVSGAELAAYNGGQIQRSLSRLRVVQRTGINWRPGNLLRKVRMRFRSGTRVRGFRLFRGRAASHSSDTMSYSASSGSS
jgi:hypothetical protein